MASLNKLNLNGSTYDIGAGGWQTTATTAATAQWYRIATSVSDIANNIGTFWITGSTNGQHSIFSIDANISFGKNPVLVQNSCTLYDTGGIRKARIVYNTTYLSNYAYLEVYLSSALATTITVKFIGNGWASVTPNTVGSIPSGYTSVELALENGKGEDTYKVKQVYDSMSTQDLPVLLSPSRDTGSVTDITKRSTELTFCPDAGTLKSVGFQGGGSGLTNLNASNLASGTVPLARIPTGTAATQVALGNHTHNETSLVRSSTWNVAGGNYWLYDGKIDTIRANRTAFLPASGVKIEHSTDGGSTFTDAGIADTAKQDLFAMTRASSLPVGGTGNVTTSMQTRVTISPVDRYTSVDQIYCWFSTSGHTTVLDIEVSTLGAQTTFTKLRSDVPLAGWSGNNLINIDKKTFGGSASQTSNYYAYRLTFKITAVSASYPATHPSILDIRLYGPDGWTTPNNMMKMDHIYSWDRDQNVTFPATVKAASFIGDINGNATTATSAKSATTATNATTATTATTATKLGSTNVGSATQPIYLAAGAPTATTYTLGANVPSGAVFTDTNYYHSSGTWNGLTYTAAAANGAPALAFTIPTGNSSTTVAAGNHSHAASSITSGTIDFARLPTGTTADKVSIGNHTHDAGYIVGGKLNIARIPTGTTSDTVALGNHVHSELAPDVRWNGTARDTQPNPDHILILAAESTSQKSGTTLCCYSGYGGLWNSRDINFGECSMSGYGARTVASAIIPISGDTFELRFDSSPIISYNTSVLSRTNITGTHPGYTFSFLGNNKVALITLCGTSGYLCLKSDTLITMSNGELRRIDSIVKGDSVKAYNPATKTYFNSIVVDNTFSDSTISDVYDRWIFEDGSFVETINDHALYNATQFKKLKMSQWNIGDYALREDGVFIKLISHEVINDTVRHADIRLDSNGYFFANGLLTAQ